MATSTNDVANGSGSLTEAAARQMKELDLSTNGSSTPKPHPPQKKPLVTKTTPRILSPSGSNHGSELGEGEKKLPMNKITVGHAPSPNVSKATSKIGSLSNTSYKPSGGRVKIEQRKLEWNAKSRVGSLGNLGHVAGGGAVKIESKPTKITASSRIGSLSNTSHTPGGGSKKIFNDTDYLKRARSSSKTETRGRSSSLQPTESVQEGK